MIFEVVATVVCVLICILLMDWTDRKLHSGLGKQREELDRLQRELLGMDDE